MKGIDLAHEILDPHKLSAMHNGYSIYRLKGQGSGPQMIIKRHERRKEIRETYSKIGEELKGEIEA